jgi:hypothetical protein
MRGLAVKANQMKVDAAALGVPLRLRIEDSPAGPKYVIERVDRCLPPQASSPGAGETKAAVWGGGSVFENGEYGKDFVVFQPHDATALGLVRVTTDLCYDPRSAVASSGVQALGVLTAKDLTVGRLDRASFLNFSGLFAEIDFD